MAMAIGTADEPGGDQQSAGRAGLPSGEPEEEPVTGACAGISGSGWLYRTWKWAYTLDKEFDRELLFVNSTPFSLRSPHHRNDQSYQCD